MSEDQKAATDGAPDEGRWCANVSRRAFVQTVGLSAAAGALTEGVRSAGAATRDDPAGAPILGPDPVEITLRINRRERAVSVEPTATLLDVLRHELDLTGTKEICDRGACGGCSVLVDGQLVVSCMMLAVDAVDSEITTIEGLASSGGLDRVQEAFIRHDALQCGYCTPGLIMATRALLDENPTPTLDEIKKGLSGNICRCGTYTNVFNAVLEASGQPVIVDEGGR